MSKTQNEREKQFRKIKRAFQERDEEVMRRGTLPMRSTAVGFWGVSNLDDVYQFFEQMDFPPETRFIDLGCGDGRVVLVASLFVQAAGIEYDEDLIDIGNDVAASLGIDVTLLCGDIIEHDLSPYDALYMYADRNFSYLEPKLRAELQGTLYLYHDTYHPAGFRKGKTIWTGQIPVFSYTNPTVPDQARE